MKRTCLRIRQNTNEPGLRAGEAKIANMEFHPTLILKIFTDEN